MKPYEERSRVGQWLMIILGLLPPTIIGLAFLGLVVLGVVAIGRRAF